jgi:hypothetical protein
MLNQFRFIPFLVGLAIGILLILFYKPEKQIIYQYPHPNEANQKVFRDKSGTCYSYSVHEVDCDTNEGTMIDYPIQA